MNLLLDARKKAQQALAGQGGSNNHSGIELSLEEYPDKVTAKSDTQPVAASSDAPSSDNSARLAGKNLFGAKSPASPLTRFSGINRNLLFALGGTVVLLAAGASYLLWYLGSAGTQQPLRPRMPVAPVAPAPQNTALAAAPAITDNVPQVRVSRRATRKEKNPTSQPAAPIHIQPQQDDTHDHSLISNAYLAYRKGKLEDAQQMYLEALGKDARNTDALLGLGAIAQQRSEDVSAMQYYARVLTMDPRNDVANAGMSALSMDQNSESRLKNLLREQRDSPALHFALGNLYARQSRWGEAQSAYFIAYTLDSKNAELSFNLAVSLDHLGQNKLAAQYYQRAMQLDPAGGDQPRSLDHAQIAKRVKDLTH